MTNEKGVWFFLCLALTMLVSVQVRPSSRQDAFRLASRSSPWQIIMDDDTEVFNVNPEEVWLEQIAVGRFRIWHIIASVLGICLGIMIMVCCCIRFRIPRTKQEIEADYQRKQITKKFREKLQQIKNSEMDDMDLQKVCARIQSDYINLKSSVESLNEKQNVKFKI